MRTSLPAGAIAGRLIALFFALFALAIALRYPMATRTGLAFKLAVIHWPLGLAIAWFHEATAPRLPARLLYAALGLFLFAGAVLCAGVYGWAPVQVIGPARLGAAIAMGVISIALAVSAFRMSRPEPR
ncbi:hypothetical protein [Tahibacter amnicola]|uniref:Uncharacterized protein n=1 Tax=Tahibacter amnicola TaxID=2976241 RepID=A0ABY6BET8_9GAMM|nr:hypothetical protein [Tahibacter amnicola]UXI68259.1 hypothetical protein N4264_01010 [Tahibacter amnicola]